MKLAIAIAILGTGFCVGFFAFNVTSMWVGWLLTVGFLAGSALESRMSRVATTICLFASGSIILTIVARALPLYALDWPGADLVEISRFDDDEWKILLTDPNEIESLMEFGKSGHYESIVKSLDPLILHITHGGNTEFYFVHGDSVGPKPGNVSQTVFVPQRKGMRSRLEELIASRDYTKK